MNATQKLHQKGQSLWLDHITRELLTSGTLRRYIVEFAITGLTSNPTIFHKAIKDSAAYDASIRELMEQEKSGEGLFFELAIEDLTQAADLFRPIFDRTSGVDGWVSLEVSPLLAHDTKTTISVAKDLHAQAGRPNVFIKIPGTKEGLPAIEAAIFAGVPINVTLLFSREHYIAAADAYLRGIERRIAAGLASDVASVASMFISRWDVAVRDEAPDSLGNQLGIAIGKRTYKAYRDLMASARWQRAFNAGARPQRLLMASTGTKDPQASDVLYIEGLAAPLTINTMPEDTLKAFSDHGRIGPTLSPDGGDCEAALVEFAKAGVDIDALAARLQDEGAASFVQSWNELIEVIAAKSTALRSNPSPLGKRQREKRVESTLGHPEDRSELNRLQEELDAARRELRDCRQARQSHRKLAVKVHESFLPQSVRHPRLNISAAFVPVDGLGGDYCQTIFPNDRECYLTISDVAGHGIDAALLASRVSSQVRYLVLQHLPPWQIVSEINTFVLQYFRETELLLSLFVAHLDLVEARLTHSGAGHPAQFLVRRNGYRLDKLNSQNMLIGVREECMGVEPEHVTAIDVGDHLVLFTDGLPETGAADDQMLGEDGLADIVMASHCSDAAHMADCILEGVKAFGSGAQGDDLTLIVAEYTS